jgi:AraC-like DNA-binding protein
LDYNINFRSLLLFLAMVQGLVIVVLLLLRGLRRSRVTDLLLAGLLFYLVLSLIEHFIGFMGVYDYMREAGHDLSFFPFSNPFMWGPLIWLYVQSVTDSDFTWQRRLWWHFLAPLLFYVEHFGVWSLPDAVKFPILESGSPFQWVRQMVNVAFYGLTFWYLYLAVQRYREYRRLLNAEFSNTGRMTLLWLRNFIYFFVAYMVIDLSFWVAGMFVDLWYTEQYWLELIRAIHLYYLSVEGWSFTQKTKVHYDLLEAREQQLALPAPATGTSAVPAKALYSSEVLIEKRQALESFMQEERPWLDPDLTLSQLATQFGLNAAQLSYLVNTGFEQNFNDFVNAYRVNEVKSRMQDPTFRHLSLLGVAFECGFNSKATFNRAFKKLTGEAPSAFAGR